MSDKKNCGCKADIESRLLKRFKEQAPEATGHEARLTGYALIIDDQLGLVSKGCMPMELTASFPLKKGGTKTKVQKQSMLFNFCPFCGVRYADKAGVA